MGGVPPDDPPNNTPEGPCDALENPADDTEAEDRGKDKAREKACTD